MERILRGEIFAGQSLQNKFNSPTVDPRTPDIILKVNTGVIFTGGSKIAEHGGANPQDRNVPLLVSGDAIEHAQVNNETVETTQIAPTILELLGLNPNSLMAVQIEHTQVLDLNN